MLALLAARDADLDEVVYLILILAGVASLLGGAYLAYLGRIPAAIALALIGVVMIVLAT